MLYETLEKAIAQQIFPGYQCVYFRGDCKYLYGGYYTYEKEIPVQADTMFDLASLTKVIFVTPMILYAIQEGYITLDKEYHGFTVQQYLTHTANLNGKIVYADENYIALGHLLEEIFQMPLDRIFDTYFKHPLGIQTTYCPLKTMWKNCAVTEVGTNSDHLLQGEVHDSKCRKMGGVSGHAGLFSNALDLHRIIQYTYHTLLKPQTIQWFKKIVVSDQQVKRTVGFIVHPSGLLYHTGFTGGLLAIDLTSFDHLILLDHRVYPTRKNQKIMEFRQFLLECMAKSML